MNKDNLLREKILQIIFKCSSNTNLNEGCSTTYAGLNIFKLQANIYSFFHSNIRLDRIAFKSSTTIGEVADYIEKNLPSDAITYLQPKEQSPTNTNSYSYSYSYTESTQHAESSNADSCKTISYSHSESIHNSLKDQIRNMEKRKYEYIVGIDFGHGETSAAICPLQWDTPVEQLNPARDLEMSGNKKVIPSAITILENGDIYIGEDALRPYRLQQADVHVCFKKAPKDINGEAEKLMICYMQEVYRLIRGNNPALLTDNNHLVYIATPSGWDKATQNLYLQMAKQAGLPIGGLTKESRAAFVRAQHDATTGIGKYVEKGAVVFDMGSSTLDFTYMSSGNKLIDHGYDCGASFIEKTIYQYYKEKKDIISEFERVYHRIVPALLFEFRKVKEQYYNNMDIKGKDKKNYEYAPTSTRINMDELTNDDPRFDTSVKVKFEPGELNSLLERVGYVKEIENAARDFVSNHINNAPIYGVFLTGGASRMDFIKPLVSKCWNIPESQIYRDQDPSLTISQGVAEVARMDLRTEGMDKKLEDEINRIKSEDEIFEFFSLNLINDLNTNVVSTVAEVVNTFKDDEEDWTLYGLQTVITQLVKENAETLLTSAPHLLNNAINAVTEDIRKEVESIVTHYSNQGIKVNVPQFDLSNINLVNVNLDTVIETISKNIEIESSNWLKYVLMGLGSIFGLIGMGIGYLAGKFFGEKELSEAEKHDKAMSKLLDSTEREQVYNAIGERWDDIRNDIGESISQAIMQNNELHNTISKGTNEILENYIKELKKARILID